jgi:hypothetical protein
MNKLYYAASLDITTIIVVPPVSIGINVLNLNKAFGEGPKGPLDLGLVVCIVV